MLSSLAIAFSIVSGVMACFLFFLGMSTEKDKKKSRVILIWACLFLAASFTTMEWAFWLEGENIFKYFFGGCLPLIYYFLVWFFFIIWLFEKRKERKIWIILLILLILISLYAMKDTKVI